MERNIPFTIQNIISKNSDNNIDMTSDSGFHDSSMKDQGSKNDLNALRDKFEKIFEDALGAMFIVNKDGIVEYANKKYLEVFRINREDIVGKPVPNDCKEGFDYVLKTGESILGQIFRTPKRLTIINKIAIKKDQEVIGAVGLALFDKLEELESLKKKIEDLEKKVIHYKARLNSPFFSKYTLEDIIGKGETIRKAKEIAIQASKTSLPVLIIGETGTGKELFAHCIHHESERRYENFVRVNCAAIPKDLFEAELFGYEPGAYTGAGKEGKPGKFELASGGTILLDEICETPQETQSKLLRVIQEKEVERLGGKEPKNIDFRLITSTNRDINKVLSQGQIREDLYYRINVIRLTVPSLRERKEDIPLLVEHFLRKLTEEQGIYKQLISEEAMNLLKQYHWPGNVRELKNVLELAAISAINNDWIEVDNLPNFIHNSNKRFVIDHNYFKNVRQETEENAILDLLRKTNYNVSLAAKSIGMHRTGLYRKIRKYGIELRRNSDLSS
jgi:transcriptional regulator with PAS, ATPase and Fis domain